MARKVKKRQPVVLVYGEDPNDTKALRELIVALCPSLDGRVKTRRQPQIHLKDVPPEQLPKRVDKIKRQIDADFVDQDVICIFIHEDADQLEPADEAIAKKIEKAFEDFAEDVCVHAVVPAWEIEAWWFQWPDQLVSLRSSWRKPDQYVGKSVGKIKDAKGELKRRVKPARASAGFLGYRESDSAAIAGQVRKDDVARSPKAESRSYDRFMESVDACCAQA